MTMTARGRPKRRFRAPLSLVTGQVSDMAVSVYALVAQLDRGPSGCYATVGYLGERLGVSRETAQRALSELGQWVNRDHSDGNLRIMPVQLHDAWVWLPNDVAEQMPARQWRLFAWVKYCGTVGRDVTPSEVAARVLTRKDGKKVSADTAKRQLLKLEASGWVGVSERPGKASLYEAYETPIPAGEAAEKAGKRRATPRNEVTAPPATGSQTSRNQITPPPGNEVTSTPRNRVTHSSVNRSGVTEQLAMAGVVRNAPVVDGDGADDSRRLGVGGTASSAGASPPLRANGGPGVTPPVQQVLLPRPGDQVLSGQGHAKFAEDLVALKTRSAEQAARARASGRGGQEARTA